jgi:hypothetical protein
VSAARHRRKSDRIEREIVGQHKILGVHAGRYPRVSEGKGRKSGAGFATLKRWLADYDALFLWRNNADPPVLLIPAAVGRHCNLKR